MPYGLQVINDDALVQIDSSYRNLHLIRKLDTPHYYDAATGDESSDSGILTPRSPTSLIAFGVDPWYADVDPAADSATIKDSSGRYVFASRLMQPYFRCFGRASYDAAAIDPRMSNGQVTVDCVTSEAYNSNNSVRLVGTMPSKSDNVKLTIYEFDFIDLADVDSKYGLQVFDDNGDLVFDALQQPMRVVGFFRSAPVFNATGFQTPPNVWTLPKSSVARKYAIAPLNAPARFYNVYVKGTGGVDDYVTSAGSVSCDAFQFQATRILHYPHGVQAPSDLSNLKYLYAGMRDVTYLLLDVTGY